ncbi:acyl-CoA dehydrogenase [Aeromicrobium chenweiae]|uniref:Acyl-CoA dehydrogenase n=1 Tax=Aeromicrobium chenweiae TaxID=2079793 RepID=A0A2S0WR65_9ACTN|nr:acyl-CoA dehydrogenase [Aeromicrobium chenweiae]AWB93724.1 acyl-CoA dehydrogenase [Aeromicrobium chenweiae]TGN30428.1 flavin-dependent monooxygenase [Aeromicrobium chenweiae]
MTYTVDESITTTTSATTLDDVLSELADRRDEFQRLGYVPRDFVDRLIAIGIYRSATPEAFGGSPERPADFLRTIEKISVIDASTGWVASFGCQLVYLGTLPAQTLAELFAEGPDVVFAGALFPVQHAEPTETGFVVDGRWKFGSGSMGADVICVGIPGDDSIDGEPRGALLRAADVEIVQDWDVLGMKASGSFDLVVHSVEVPREWTFIRGGEPSLDEPLYCYPAITYAAQSLAVTSAGVARAALDHALKVGAGVAGVTGAPELADRAYYRAGIAQAEAQLRSGAPTSSRLPRRPGTLPWSARSATSSTRTCGCRPLAWLARCVLVGRRRGHDLTVRVREAARNGHNAGAR